MRLRFLGTGASGGTPGAGRSARLESSLLLTAAGRRLLLDATRHLDRQLAEAPDAVALTHGHRDASGGIPALAGLVPDGAAVPVCASEETHRVLAGRYARREHIEPVTVAPGEPQRLGDDLHIDACDVPHAARDRFRTYAWRVRSGDRTLVYASDVARPTDDLERFARGADLLVVDGAMYRQSIFSHLRIDQDLPTICGWDVGSVLLTQIGRTAPVHEQLEEVVAALCPRAAPAYDGLELNL